MGILLIRSFATRGASLKSFLRFIRSVQQLERPPQPVLRRCLLGFILAADSKVFRVGQGGLEIHQCTLEFRLLEALALVCVPGWMLARVPDLHVSVLVIVASAAVSGGLLSSLGCYFVIKRALATLRGEWAAAIPDPDERQGLTRRVPLSLKVGLTTSSVVLVSVFFAVLLAWISPLAGAVILTLAAMTIWAWLTHRWQRWFRILTTLTVLCSLVIVMLGVRWGLFTMLV